VVKNILRTYKATAAVGAHVGLDRAHRLAAFFKRTGLPFTKYHIDDWRGSRYTLKPRLHIVLRRA